MPMPTPVIEVKNLIKRYRKAKQNAVDDISFAVESGEFFALLGPNGAGKTTTISILTTTLAKTSGQLTVAGHNLDKDPSGVRRSIGVIFQNPSLDENLTAEENIRFHTVLYGLYSFRPTFKLMPAEYQDRVRELGQVLSLEKEMFAPVKSFSGCMKRKLEIVRSLMHKPKVLFLDEPTSGLDPISRRNLWSYLRQVRENENTTIFLTTHYLEEAEEADRVCIINQGQITALGTPHELKKNLIENYLIVDATNRSQLHAEARQLNLGIEGDGPFKVNLNHHPAQKVIKSIETELTQLEIHTPTLEEAYLEIIGKE